jgi:hypothetical protein
MKKLLLSLLIGLFLVNQSQSQNVNLSNSPYFEGECYLAVNPLNPKHLVGAWIHFSLSNVKDAMATRTSFDGGKTWTPLQTLPHLYPKFTSADPTIYFGKDSCVYFAFIDLSGLKTSDSGYIMVTRSTNGGVTWNTPVKAIGWKDTTNLPIDRPWIAADHSNGPYAGRVYLTSQNAYFAPQPHHPWFTYSTDSGATWAPIKQLDDSIPSGNVTDATAFTTISANGTFYGAYISYYTTYSLLPRLVVVKSSNGGASFTPYIAYTYSVSDELPAADTLIKGGFCFTSNPADSTNLIITEPTNHFGQPDIVSYNTHDAGKTWGGPVRLNDDPVGAYDTCHDLVWGGFAPNGTFAATWRDRRNTGTGDTVGFKIYGTTSHDGGNSYTPNFVISDTISPPIMIDHGDDFMGCAVTDSNVYALWSDLRTGKENTYFNSTPFSKIPLGIASISNNPGIRVDAYPNPFHDEVNVAINSAAPLQNCKLQVFDITGKKINEMEIPANGTYKLKFNSPAAGTYLWSLVEQGKAIAQGKWVIQ